MAFIQKVVIYLPQRILIFFQTFRVEYSTNGNSWSSIGTFNAGRAAPTSGVLTEFNMVRASHVRVYATSNSNVRIAIYAKEPKYDSGRLCKAMKSDQKCQCNDILCDEGLFCIEGNCADKPRCIVKDGSAVNPLDCQCGKSECIGSNRFCYETLEICSNSELFVHSSGKRLPICQNNDASRENENECICGETVCGANEYCFEEFNSCSDAARCADREALMSNGVEKCMCGSTNCEGVNSFCLESESVCAKGPECTYANGKYKNSGLGCICGSANCEGDDMFLR